MKYCIKIGDLYVKRTVNYHTYVHFLTWQKAQRILVSDRNEARFWSRIKDVQDFVGHRIKPHFDGTAFLKDTEWPALLCITVEGVEGDKLRELWPQIM